MQAALHQINYSYRHISRRLPWGAAVMLFLACLVISWGWWQWLNYQSSSSTITNITPFPTPAPYNSIGEIKSKQKQLTNQSVTLPPVSIIRFSQDKLLWVTDGSDEILIYLTSSVDERIFTQALEQQQAITSLRGIIRPGNNLAYTLPLPIDEEIVTQAPIYLEINEVFYDNYFFEPSIPATEVQTL